MWDLLKVIFLGSTLCFTQNPITIATQWVELQALEPFSAVNAGAVIFLDIPISEREMRAKGVGNAARGDNVSGLFSSKDIQIVLIKNNEAEISMPYSGCYVYALAPHEEDDRCIRAIFRFPYGLKEGDIVGIDFVSVKIKSRLLLEDVRVYWVNCGL